MNGELGCCDVRTRLLASRTKLSCPGENGEKRHSNVEARRDEEIDSAFLGRCSYQLGNAQLAVVSSESQDEDGTALAGGHKVCKDIGPGDVCGTAGNRYQRG